MAGGLVGGNYLDSTETLAAGSSTWSYGAKLPRKYSDMASVSGGNIIYLIGNITIVLLHVYSVYIVGGSDDSFNRRSEVMKYENSKWIQAGTIRHGRSGAAATMVKMDINMCG